MGRMVSALFEGDTKKLFKMFDKMAEAVWKEAEKIKVPMSFAICDDSGHLQYFRRMPNTLLVSTAIAQNKAYTSAYLKMPTDDLAPAAQPNAMLFGIHTCDPKMVVFGGGIPLMKDGVVVGAVGVSGGSVPEDIQCADKAIEVFNSMI